MEHRHSKLVISKTVSGDISVTTLYDSILWVLSSILTLMLVFQQIKAQLLNFLKVATLVNFRAPQDVNAQDLWGPRLRPFSQCGHPAFVQILSQSTYLRQMLILTTLADLNRKFWKRSWIYDFENVLLFGHSLYLVPGHSLKDRLPWFSISIDFCHEYWVRYCL